MRFVYEEMSEDSDGHKYRFDVDPNRTLITLRQEVAAWCEEHFGPPATLIRGSRWTSSGRLDTYWLRDESDAFEFKMRWC